MFQAQAKCNIIDHQCAPVIALCLRQDCKIQSTCCIRCIKIHRDCTDYIKLLDDEIPEEISQFETLRVWFSDTFDQIKQQIKQLEQMVILYFLPIDQYSMQPTLSNLNKLGQLLKSLKSQDILQLEEQKQNIGLILDRSLKMISDKNFQELKQIDAVVAPQEDKNFIEKYYKEGYELYRDKQYLEAIVCFDEVLKLDKEHIDSLHYKGDYLDIFRMFIIINNCNYLLSIHHLEKCQIYILLYGCTNVFLNNILVIYILPFQ